MSATIPTILDDALQVLPPIELEALGALLGRPSSYNLQREKDSAAGVLRSALIRLGVTPVAGRGGHLVYRAWVGSKLAVLVDNPADPDPEHLQRLWVTARGVDHLVKTIQTFIQEAAENSDPVTILSEDHPEEQAIGFSCPEANRIWVLPVQQLERELQASTIATRGVSSLISSAKGREALAKALTTGEVAKAGTFALDPLTASISARYKERYLPGREA